MSDIVAKEVSIILHYIQPLHGLCSRTVSAMSNRSTFPPRFLQLRRCGEADSSALYDFFHIMKNQFLFAT